MSYTRFAASNIASPPGRSSSPPTHSLPQEKPLFCIYSTMCMIYLVADHRRWGTEAAKRGRL